MSQPHWARSRSARRMTAQPRRWPDRFHRPHRSTMVNPQRYRSRLMEAVALALERALESELAPAVATWKMKKTPAARWRPGTASPALGSRARLRPPKRVTGGIDREGVE